MLLLLLALLSVALADSVCFPNPPFESPAVLDDQVAIALIAQDFRLAVWNLPETNTVDEYIARLEALFAFEFRAATLTAVTTAVNNRVEIMVNAKAGATQAQITAFTLCLATERALVAAIGTSFRDNITQALNSIQWPTPAWQALRDQAEASNDIAVILTRWIESLVGQILNRIKIIGLYLVHAADERHQAFLAAYDAIIGYANGDLTAEQMRTALNDLVLKLLDENRITLLIAYHQTQWNAEVTRFNQALQNYRNGLRYYYRDFVTRFRAAVADGTSNLNAQLKQALLDYLAGYGINPDSNIELTVVYTGTTANATLTISFTLNIPDFYILPDPQATGQHIQDLIVRWLVIHFQLDPAHVRAAPYVVPAKRAAGDQMTVTLASQSGAGSLTAALLVFILAFLFHWTD